MRIGIIGGGFGLYGYLPALSQHRDVTILLPMRYQKRVKERADIRHLYSDIEWVNDNDAVLNQCDGLIIALPPVQQYEWVKKCLYYGHINHLFLEKPLASSPELAHELLSNLILSKKKFRVGYNFRHTEWGQSVRKKTHGVKQVHWHFRAHHYAENLKTWKREHDQGGGALRFYGIHLIALLAELGYTDVTYSKMNMSSNNVSGWDAELTGDSLVPCEISISSNSDSTRFDVVDSSGENYKLSNPFQVLQQQKKSNTDLRVPFLTQGLQDLFCNHYTYHNWYHHTNLLWSNIEKVV